MTWSPNSGLLMFEPGCIQCTHCGFKPDDPWDEEPEDFEFFAEDDGWLCECCSEEMGGSYVAKLNADKRFPRLAKRSEVPNADR